MLDALLERLATVEDDEVALHPFRLALAYEYREQERLLQLAYESRWPVPPGLTARPQPVSTVRDPERFDATVSGVGALAGAGFVFDNEKWLTPVRVKAFEIGADPVTQGEFLAFVLDGAYRDPQWWDAGWFARMRERGQRMPLNWVNEDGRTRVRWFDQVVPLDPSLPMWQVSAHEAEAYCRWLGRRLPTEAEWCVAARHGEAFRWGDAVFEWTSSTFDRLQGFRADACTEFSTDAFGTHRVLKGASFATPRDLVSPVYRHFLRPGRAAPFVGFRVADAA